MWTGFFFIIFALASNRSTPIERKSYTAPKSRKYKHLVPFLQLLCVCVPTTMSLERNYIVVGLQTHSSWKVGVRLSPKSVVLYATSVP